MWHVAQSLDFGAMSASAEWHGKQVVCVVGAVLNVPFFNQKASPKLAGGLVTYSSLELPCGL